MLGRLRRARRVLAPLEDSYRSVPGRAARSLARDVVIATLEPDDGRCWRGTTADLVVAGALLVELAREGRLGASGTGKKVRVTVRDASPLGDIDLDDALLSTVSGLAGSKATRLISFVATGSAVLRHLVADGVVVQESRRRLGFTVRRYHPTPAAGRDELVARLRSVLLGESVPDDRTALLIAVLGAGAGPKRWVPKQHLDDAHRRTEEIHGRLGEDERALVSALTAAVISASSD